MPSMRIGTEVRRIGAYLSVPPSIIDWAIAVQNEELSIGNAKPIGEILIEREQISYEDLRTALESQRRDRLRQCTLFADLTDSDLAHISEKSEDIALVQGQELLKQDAQGDSIYAVLCGRLLIYRRENHQEELPVGVAVAGDFLGDTDYFSQGSRNHTACAIEPALLLRVRYESLRACPSFSQEKALAAHDSVMGPADTDELVERIARRAAQVLEADLAHFYLLNNEAGELSVKVAAENEIRSFRVRVGAEVVGSVAQTGDLVVLTEAYLDNRFNPHIDIWTGYWSRTLLAGPVRDARGAVIGVIQVVNKKKGFFNQDDEVLFRAFARQASTAFCAGRKSIGTPVIDT